VHLWHPFLVTGEAAQVRTIRVDDVDIEIPFIAFGIEGNLVACSNPVKSSFRKLDWDCFSCKSPSLFRANASQ
jgi:hypothetical protein